MKVKLVIPTTWDGIEIEQETEEEVSSAPFVKEERTVLTRATDPEIESLYGKFKRGKLILDPDFQRRFVWDRQKASSLIESALLNVPLPIIYLAEEGDGKESVIDGQQRLTSFFAFVDGVLPGGEIFRLTKMKKFRELENKTYKELGEDLQDKIRYSQIRVITILNNSDPKLKFEIFERLNRGAVSLNPMELRNCVYQGNYMQFLKFLAQDSDFSQRTGFKVTDPRMRDVELVLRFAAFYHTSHLNYKGPMKEFLNSDMEKYKNITKEEADRLRAAFKNALQIMKSLFGDSTFRRFHSGTRSKPDGSWKTNIVNAALYDALMGVFYDKDKNQVYAALDALREGIIDLMVSDEEFIDTILSGTSDEARVKRRYRLLQNRVDEILQKHERQPRCFSLQLKKDLYEKDPTCVICNNRISSLDDAAVDHIHQYWKGGQTIPENARLVHRYCNLARLRND
ncbi:MAG TPA: DUF262 domain-containing protein [Ktedonobacteraceae bacterium]